MAESGNRVLIADDDETVQSVLFKVVGSNGIDAIIASGGEEALKPAARSRFDLILPDVNMRGIDGFEVIRTLRSRDVETPIIIFVI